jgi:hypothetical protein
VAGSGEDHNRSTQPLPGEPAVHVNSGATGHGSMVGANVGAYVGFGVAGAEQHSVTAAGLCTLDAREQHA